MVSDAYLLKRLKKYREHIFRSHVNYVLRAYLEDWINEILNYRPIEPIKYTAIIIEDRPGELIKFSIYNTLLMSKLKIKIILFTTQNSFKPMQKMFDDLKHWVKVVRINDQNNNLTQINTLNYNKIFKSSIFWESIPTRHVLVFQTDALLIEPIDFDMFKYDYIGAPFAANKYLSTPFPEISEISKSHESEKWITQIFNQAVPIPDDISVGNGGLSIRNRDVMIDICKNEYSPANENEDIYFSRLIKRYSKNIAPFDIAKRFSCECTYHKSIGFHASYLYLTQEQQAEIYERHVKYIFALIDFRHDVAFRHDAIISDRVKAKD